MKMKIIEAMKKIKDLVRKAEDIRTKIQKSCADLDNETPLFPDQKNQVDSWLQAHSDLVKEIMRLRVAIQRTNMATQVTMDLGGKEVVKTIAEWVLRRRESAKMELLAWQCLTDRGLREGSIPQSTGGVREVRIRRYYDPEQRDGMIDRLKSEPLMIDAKLEVINAITDLIE